MYLLFSPSKELTHGNRIFHLKTRKEENYLATKFLTQLNLIEYIVSDYCQVSESGLFRKTVVMITWDQWKKSSTNQPITQCKIRNGIMHKERG